MKKYLKSIIAVAAMLLCSTMTQAGKVIVITQVDGKTSTAGGTATVDKSSDVSGGETVTITVSPSQGYYLNPADITVIKTIDGSQAQARGVGVSEPLEVTHTSGNDVTGTATYTFVIPETGVSGVTYDAEVTVNFSQRISIENAEVTATGTFTYTGEAIVPETITVKLDETTLTVTTDYTLGISDNINSGDATITATGVGKYTGTATGKFAIGKANPVLSFSSATASITFGNESAFIKPTLTTTPEGLTVTYESKSTDKATVDATTGDITPVAAGENIEIKANFAGNDNYKSGSASYTLTVVKGTAAVSKAPTAKELTYTGSAQALVNAGEATNGEMQYKIGKDGTYSTNIPTGTEANDYTVYYKAATTNANQFNDSEEASVTVTITPKSIATVTIEDIADQTYTGEPIDPTVTVKDGDKTLTLDTDYTVSYSNNIDAALATAVKAPTVTITGKGNYDPNTTATKTFTIGKAQATLSFSEKTATATVGEDFTEPTLTKTPADITVTFTSSRLEIASVNDKTGEVTPLAEGETVIKATFVGNDNYEPVEASYTLTVNKGVGNGYPLWIGDVQVTEDNKSDVFGNGTERKPATFIFNPKNNTLVITGETTPYEIETRLPKLKIFLNEISYAKRIFYYDPSNPSSKGELIFTQDPNFPGMLVLKTDNGNSVISGFSSVDYEYRLTVTDPECTNYYDSELRTEDGARAQTATIGQGLINPLVKNELVTFPPGDFVGADLSNYAVKDILYTLNPYVDGEGYDYGRRYDGGARAKERVSNGEECSICFVSTTTEDIVNVVAQNVDNGSYFPGSETFASAYTGITFMVPGGEGNILIDAELSSGYLFHLKIGTDSPEVINNVERSVITIPYNVNLATYIYLYLVEGSGGDTPIDKANKGNGRLFSVKVSPYTAYSPNSVSEVSDDFPSEQTPHVEIEQNPTPTAITGVIKDNMTNDKWFNIGGQQITKPNKKGVYIKNRKKVVIK